MSHTQTRTPESVNLNPTRWHRRGVARCARAYATRGTT